MVLKGIVLLDFNPTTSTDWMSFKFGFVAINRVNLCGGDKLIIGRPGGLKSKPDFTMTIIHGCN